MDSEKYQKVKIHLVKQLNGSFLPAYESDHEKVKKIKGMSMVECDIKQPRNIKFHRKFFALINLVYQNQPEEATIQNIDHLRKYLTKRAGFYDTIETPTGTIYEAKSISFAKMSQDDFDNLYDAILDTIVKIYAWDRDDIADSIADFY